MQLQNYIQGFGDVGGLEAFVCIFTLSIPIDMPVAGRKTDIGISFPAF